MKILTKEKRRDYLDLESNYHFTKLSIKILLAIEMKKTRILMNKPVYLGLSALGLSKTVIYESWYDYVKSKCGEKAAMCYMDTGSFFAYIKADNIYKVISEDVETRFDT